LAEAHNHHFVPQGYLRNFADGVGRKARVHVVDRVEGKTFQTLVRNIAAARDFNRVDAEGMHPNALEEAYSEFEGPASEALGRIRESNSFAVEEDRLLVLNLVALLASRNPRTRGTMDRFMGDVFKSMAEIMVSTKERWETFQEQARASGNKGGEDELTYEEACDLIKSGKLTFGADQTYLIGLEMQMMEPILKMLVPRKWTLHVAAEGAGEFVTTDHPVCLVPVGWDPGLYGVGFGLANTAVLFPVSRELLLTGRFEGEEAVRQQSAVNVAQLNSMVIQFAERQVYSYNSDFKYARNVPPAGLTVMNGAELVRDPLWLKGPAENDD